MLLTKSRIVPVVLTIGSFVALASTAAYSSLGAEQDGKQKTKDALTDDEFHLLHEKLTKMSTERVWSIPWQLSVREARKLAAKENKPVFLWISSNGGTHPLGPC